MMDFAAGGAPIVANARLMQGRLTGQPRYFHEIRSRLDGAVEQLAPSRPLGRTAGHLWEQCVLPLWIKRRLLWSPSNTGPIGVRRQVVTIHDTSMFDHPEWFDWKFARWYRFLLPRLAGVARRILAVSEFARRRLSEHLSVPFDKIVVAPNAVAADFRPARQEEVARVRRTFAIDRPYVLVVGSVQPRKNLARLLDAWGRLGCSTAGIELVIAGGTGRVFSGAGIDSLPPRCRMLGYVDEPDLAPLYGGAFAFCYPSLYEGFGMPPLEAMACGAPVLTSRTTSLPEVVGDAALLVDPYDTDAIADGLRRLIGDESLRATLRERGFRQCRRYSWDESAATVWRVLQEAAAKG